MHYMSRKNVLSDRKDILLGGKELLNDGKEIYYLGWKEVLYGPLLLFLLI